MLLYSKTINAFTGKVKKIARKIMNEEMGLRFNKTRFEWRGYYYPLHFVLFEDPNMLGYYRPANFQMGLHKKLMYLAHDEVLTNVIRHELAHMYCFLLYKDRYKEMDSHGKEYRDVCRKFSWDERVYKAYSNLEFENQFYSEDKDFESVKKKIEKLLSLASSDNPHEAELATVKANELLLKYNMKNLTTDENEIESCVKTVHQNSKMNATLNALYDILQYFYVQPVFNRNTEAVSLDVVGSKANVEMADYVAKFLVNEFELFWKKAKKDDPNLKGLKMKNNYIMGLAHGFGSKLAYEQQMSAKAQATSKEVMKIKDVLIAQVKLAYPRLSRQAGPQGGYDPRARAKGKQDGAGLSIRPGVKQGNLGKLLN